MRNLTTDKANLDRILYKIGIESRNSTLPSNYTCFYYLNLVSHHDVKRIKSKIRIC